MLHSHVHEAMLLYETSRQNKAFLFRKAWVQRKALDDRTALPAVTWGFGEELAGMLQVQMQQCSGGGCLFVYLFVLFFSWPSLLDREALGASRHPFVVVRHPELRTEETIGVLDVSCILIQGLTL